ncbi:MAG: hypothetical protein RIR06_2006 [Bacteroidota bacterium]|jgi:hypothetical protein
MTNKSIRDYINLIENAQREEVDEGLGKDLKRLATGKDVKSRAGQEIAKAQQASMTGDNKTAHKHFKRYDRLDKLANKEQGVAEGTEQIYKVVALDKGNALKKPTKMKVKADSIEDLFARLSANDWYPLEINGIEVIAGKRLKKSVDEEQLEETSPEAIEKVNQLYRN